MKARFFCRVVRCDREGYYYTDWSKATPVVVTADNRQGAVNEASRLMGEPPHGYYWGVRVDRMMCDPATCLCCVCVLRRSDEFGAAFVANDECCVGCHAEMTAPGWPGLTCPLPPASDQGAES